MAGLAIRHEFIRPSCPTDQAETERNHRTLQGWTQDGVGLTNLTAFQSCLDEERYQHNHLFLSPAHGCHGYPPMIAHPLLLLPRRPYTLKQELTLFDIQCVFDFLARLSFHRKVHQTTAQIDIGEQKYLLTCKLLRLHHLTYVRVRMDPLKREWVVFTDNQQQELIQLKPKD